MSKSKFLAKRFGGTWKYDGICTWNCDDGRYVARCSPGVDQWDNPLGPPEYWMNDGKQLIQVYFYEHTLLR